MKKTIIPEKIFKHPKEIFKRPLNKTTQPCLVIVVMVCGKLTAPTRNLYNIISNIWQDKKKQSHESIFH